MSHEWTEAFIDQTSTWTLHWTIHHNIHKWAWDTMTEDTTIMTRMADIRSMTLDDHKKGEMRMDRWVDP